MESLRILFISPYLPSLIRVRPYNLIQYLARRGHQITLLALVPPNEDESGLDDLRAWCHQVKTIPLPRRRTYWNALRALPSQTPLQAAYSRSPEMAALIQQTQAQMNFDVAHVEHMRGSELSFAVKDIPLVLAGYSPGQPEPERMLYEFSRKMICETDWTPPELRRCGVFSEAELSCFFNPCKYIFGKFCFNSIDRLL